MKRIFFRSMLVLMAVSGLILTSCKKNTTVDDVTSAQDNSNVSQHMNASIDDVSNAAGNSGALAGKTYGPWVLVGATIDSSQKAQGIITLTYDGVTVVDGRFTRSGSVTVQLVNYPATHWIDQGAVLDITFNAVKYTNVYTGAHYQYDGAHQITNVSGGLAWRIVAGLDQGTVTHRHSASNVTVTFNNGSQRIWNFNRIRTYSNVNGVISLSISADQTEGNYTNVDAWGTNRNGNAFYDQLLTPVVFTNNCNTNYRDPVSGEAKHYVNGVSLDVLFGVNAAGIVTGTCPDYGYKVTYTNRQGQSISRVLQYWY